MSQKDPSCYCARGSWKPASSPPTGFELEWDVQAQVEDAVKFAEESPFPAPRIRRKTFSSPERMRSRGAGTLYAEL